MLRHDSLRLRARAFIYVRVCLLAMIFAVICAVALAAPSAVAQTSTPQYLFLATGVPNGQGAFVNGIVTFTVDPTSGALTQITPPPVQTRAVPGALAINNAGTFLFATATNSASQGAVESFSVASDGSLTEVAASPFTVSNPLATPITLAVSPNGQYLYVASSVPFNESTEAPQSTILDVFAIAANGSLALSTTFAYSAIEVCDPPTPTRLTPVQLFVHPTQKWLYLFMASSFGEGCSGQPSEVQPFTINADGTLTPGTLDILPLYATNGYALTGSPDGTLLFLMTTQNPEDGIIYVSGIDQTTGDISFALVYSYPSGPGAMNPVLSTGGLAVDSTSSYLYSSAGTFQIQDGTITALASISSPYIGGASLLASPSLPFVFAEPVLESGGEFLSDEVNSDGSLAPAPGSPYTFSGGGMVLSGAAPIPTKAVMWIFPDGQINITGVAVGQTGSSGLTISNVGYGPLTISNITVTGDPSLTLSNQCTSPIAPPRGNCATGVTFTPTSVGTFTGTLTIETNVDTRAFAISATSVTPPPPMPDPIFNAPNPILFPDTATGSSSPLTFQLQNGSTATGPMTVSSITIGGSNPGDFSATSTCTAAPIAVGSSCSVTITFAPQALGGRAATLSFNGPSGTLAGATLTGTGVTTVTKFTFSTSVVGPGTITQSPTGTSFANNTTITVTETPNANSSFVNWGSTTCSSVGVNSCTVVLNANTTVTANFAANVSLTTSVVGPGTITQSPTGTSFAPGSQVVLTAVPNAGATFVSWASSTGCFPGTPATECIVTLNANTTVTATFSGAQVSLSTTAVGPGMITQSPTGTSFASGTAITLTAVPDTGATFTSWSGGACSGSSTTTCAFNISANTSVTATFSSPPVVTTPAPSQTGAAGASFTFPLSATGFSTAPTYSASCSIPAGSCTINGTTLVVTTTARTSMMVHQVAAWVAPSGGVAIGRRGGNGVSAEPRVSVALVAETLLALLAGMMLVSLASARVSIAAVRLPRPAPALATLLAFAGLALLVACGGSGGGTTPTGTPAGTYTVAVTATAGTQTAKTNLSVIVQ